MPYCDIVFHTGQAAGRPVQATAARLILEELLTHSDTASAQLLQELAQTGAQLPPLPLRVVTIMPGMILAPFSMAHAQAFQQAMEASLTQQLPLAGLFCYVQGGITGLVSTPDSADTQRLAACLQAVLEAYPLEARPRAAISSPCTEVTMISRGCVENHEAKTYARFMTQPMDIVLQNTAPESPENSGAAIMEDEERFGLLAQKICNAMLAEDQRLLQRAIDEALEAILSGLPRISAIHMRAIHFSKPLELILVQEDLIDRLFVEQSSLIPRIIQSESEATLRETFRVELQRIAQHASQRKKLHATQRARLAMDYIDKNCTDCMLSAESISKHLHISPPRLSAEFRQHYGVSMQEIIHQRRIEQLKHLLTDTQRPIQELALEVGYISVATMNRAFVRLVGMYPGQYRKQHCEGIPELQPPAPAP